MITYIAATDLSTIPGMWDITSLKSDSGLINISCDAKNWSDPSVLASDRYA